jgi:hypothetical protein
LAFGKANGSPAGISRDPHPRDGADAAWAPPRRNFLLEISAPAFDSRVGHRFLSHNLQWLFSVALEMLEL